jgi:hypothetical protein
MKFIYVALLSLLLPFAVSATAPSITGPSYLCVGSLDSFSATPSGGTWSTSSGSIATLLAPGVVYGVAAGTATISYTVGSTTATATVSVLAAPSVPAISGPSTICVGTTATLTDAASGGTWSTSSSSVLGIGSATGIITGISAGTATASYTLTNACGSSSATHPVVVSPSVTLTTPITGPTSTYIGGHITLANATSGGSWSCVTPSRATINSSTGVVTGIATGVAVIYYTISGTCGYAMDSTFITIYGSTGIAQHNEANAISTYPNPTTGELNISWAQPMAGDAAVTISDVTGKAILTETISLGAAATAASINLSGLENGVYFIAIKAGEINYNNKVVVAH